MLLDSKTDEVLVKIVDFGIAKLLPEANKETFHLTQAGQIFGSPLFMSPEQCANRAIDNRTDIYAVGATMYNALTGRPPFDGPTLAEVIYCHLKEKPKPLNEVRSDRQFPEKLQHIVARCLEKQPSERFPSMAALRAELQTVFGAKKVSAEVRTNLINVVVAEDSDEIATRITESLAVSGGIAVTARAKSGEEAIDKVMQFSPQALLVDVNMPGLDGVQVTKQLKALSPNIRVLVFSTHDDYNSLINALSSGADGYIFQDLSPQRLGPAIKAIVNGIPWIDPEITSRVLRQSAHKIGKKSLDTSTRSAAKNDRLDHASFLEALADIYVTEKKYDEAEALYHGSMALCEKAWGKDSSELAPIMTKLADIFMARQKSAAAEQLYLRALEIRFHNLGQEHIDVASSLENLAMLFQFSGGFAEAERFYLWSLRIKQKLLDKSNEPSLQSLAMSYQKIGNLYRSMNRSSEAEQMEKLASGLREDLLSSTRMFNM